MAQDGGAGPAQAGIERRPHCRTRGLLFTGPQADPFKRWPDRISLPRVKNPRTQAEAAYWAHLWKPGAIITCQTNKECVVS